MSLNNSILLRLKDGLWHPLDKLCLFQDESISSEVDVRQWLEGSPEIFEIKDSQIRWAEPQALLGWDLVRSVLLSVVAQRLVSRSFLTIAGSTNDSVKELPCGEGYALCVAEQQLAGRGRRGHNWLSPLARNLYFSLRFQREGFEDYPKGLSLAVGIVVARALNAFLSGEVRVKWPNDLYLQGKKLGGILVEIVMQPDSRLDVVVGIGLNVNMDDVVAEVGQPWVSLSDLYGIQDRNRILAEIVTDLVTCFDEFSVRGGKLISSNWAEYDLAFGQDVSVVKGQETFQGIGAGINDDYAYLVEVDGDVLAVDSADASLRLL